MNERILNFLLEIPTGKVVSYLFIAKKFNIHARQVAKILKDNNNQDIYPCYKVIRNDGKISGYNLGVDEKIRRLKKDGIEVQNNKISKDYFYIGNME